MFYNYVLQSTKNSNIYIGFTKDLKKRIKEHNDGYNQATRPYKPYKLIYYEANINEQDAKSREKYLKSGQGKCYLKNRLKRFLVLTG